MSYKSQWKHNKIGEKDNEQGKKDVVNAEENDAELCDSEESEMGGT